MGKKDASQRRDQDQEGAHEWFGFGLGWVAENMLTIELQVIYKTLS